MVKHRFKLLATSFILFAMTIGVAYVYSGNSQKPVVSQASEVEPLVESNDSEIVSPDGKMTLVVKHKKNGSENTWTFFISDKNIVTTPLADGIKMVIPFNTFSPDNKYFFLEETSKVQTQTKVFTTSGKPFAGGDGSLEIRSLFNQKYPDFTITEVTGWAAPTLIVINTDKLSGGQGPSFWFDVTTSSFYRLSTRFN